MFRVLMERARCAVHGCEAISTLALVEQEETQFCSPTCLYLWHTDAFAARRRRDSPTSTGPATIVPVRIERVIDGDTVVDTHKVHYRLVGIDAPERSQAGGPDATRALEAMLSKAKFVGVRGTALDKYRRVLADLVVADDAAFTQNVTSLNERMAAEGWAWSYARSSPASGPDFLAMERDARADKRGIWAMQNVEHVLPHDYRRMVREQGKKQSNK